MPIKNERSGHTSEKDTDEPATFVCPVCGKSVSEPHLPDTQSVIKEGWYFLQKTRIVDSEAILLHEFVHSYDEEEDIGMEESHAVVAVISAEFDGRGECIVFDILEIRSCDTGDCIEEDTLKGDTKTIRRHKDEDK